MSPVGRAGRPHIYVDESTAQDYLLMCAIVPSGDVTATRARMRALRESVWALFLPVIIIGGLRGGIFTPTEAAVVAAVYALLISLFVYREIGFRDLGPIFIRAANTTAIVMFLVAAAMVGKTGYRIDAPWWILFNGAVIMPISFFCLAAGPRYISGPEVSMFYLLETIFAPVWVWMIFAEVPSRNSLIGGGILIVTLVAHSLWQLHEGRRRRAATVVRHPA